MIKTALVVLSAALLCSCTTPGLMNQSGRVIPHQGVSAGASQVLTLPSQTASALTDQVEDWAEALGQADSITADFAFNQVNKAILSYSVDPLGFGPQWYLRYGLFPRLELGYLRGGKANQLQARYQFLGPESGRSEQSDRFYGAAGLQFAWVGFSLPGVFGKLQDRLGYSFTRKDLLIPVTFSYSLGPDEKYGSISAGLCYGHHWVKYSMVPSDIFTPSGIELGPVHHKNNYHSLALFLNVKAGYRHIYLIPSLAVYYRNYGTYQLLNGSVSLQGVTVITGLSLQLDLYQIPWSELF